MSVAAFQKTVARVLWLLVPLRPGAEVGVTIAYELATELAGQPFIIVSRLGRA